MNEHQIRKIQLLLDYVDSTIASNERIIESHISGSDVSDREIAYVKGVNLVDGDVRYIRKRLAEILDD